MLEFLEMFKALAVGFIGAIYLGLLIYAYTIPRDKKVILAFLFAPIFPTIFIALFAWLTMPNMDSYAFWFLKTFIIFGLLLGYIIIFCIMVPLYSIFERFLIKNIFFYILTGAVSGGLANYLNRGGDFLNGYIIPVLWGSSSAAIFWLIARPDKKFINHLSNP